MDKYCPACTGKLDEKNSCWIPCEYDHDPAAKNEKYPPLTLAQALDKRLQWTSNSLAAAKKLVAKLNREKKTLVARLTE